MANNIKIIGNTVLVSKTFYNKATTYGTTEFFEWMKILNIIPNAKMEVKKINRAVHKVNIYSYLSYENMEKYINEFSDNNEEDKNEYERVKDRSYLYKNRHRYVTSWFIKKFADYEGKTEFWGEIAKSKKKATISE